MENSAGLNIARCSEPMRRKKINVASQPELETIQLFAFVFLLLWFCLTGSDSVCKEIALSYKMAEKKKKTNEEANSLSSQLHEEDIRKPVNDGGNNIMPVAAPWPAAR